jgi:hypothetical protein
MFGHQIQNCIYELLIFITVGVKRLPLEGKVLLKYDWTSTGNYNITMYRVSTKELYTLKMIQETNAEYFKFHVHTSQ